MLTWSADLVDAWVSVPWLPAPGLPVMPPLLPAWLGQADSLLSQLPMPLGQSLPRQISHHSTGSPASPHPIVPPFWLHAPFTGVGCPAAFFAPCAWALQPLLATGPKKLGEEWWLGMGLHANPLVSMLVRQSWV